MSVWLYVSPFLFVKELFLKRKVRKRNRLKPLEKRKRVWKALGEKNNEHLVVCLFGIGRCWGGVLLDFPRIVGEEGKKLTLKQLFISSSFYSPVV